MMVAYHTLPFIPSHIVDGNTLFRGKLPKFNVEKDKNAIQGCELVKGVFRKGGSPVCC